MKTPFRLPATESVQFRVHGVDGSIRTFTQRDASLIRQTLNWLQPTYLFTQKRIEIPGDHGLTTFIADQVTRINLITDPCSNWHLPADLVEAVELSKPAFWALARGQQPQEAQKAPPAPGNTAMVLLDIALAGGQHVFLAQETTSPQPSQGMRSSGTFLTATSCSFLMRTGGVAVLNVANVMCFTPYPDPARASAGVWAAARQRNDNMHGNAQREAGLPEISERVAA